MILAQDAMPMDFTNPVPPGLLALALIPLFGLAVLSILGLPVLLIAKWGRWRLLFSVLTPLTLASVVMTFIATLMHDRFAVASAPLPTGLEIGRYLGVGLSIGLPVTFAIVTLFALADKRRWGVIACLVGAPVALLTLLVGARVSNEQYHRAQALAAIETESAAILLEQERLHAQVNSRVAKPAAEIASDAELLAIAAAEPGIPLEDEGESETPTGEAAAGDLNQVPDWVTAGPGPGQEVLTTGPILSRNQCINKATTEHLAWVWERMREQRPDLNLEEDAIALPRNTRPAEVVSRFMVASSLERRSTSVGEVYFQHILARARDTDVAWLAERLTARPAERRRRTGLTVVALGGGALVGMVGLLHLLLRGGERPAAEGGA